MPRIEWNDSLKLGVSEIDKQHEKLIGLINDLYDAVTQGKAQDIVADIVSEAHDYIDYHFSTEQRLMDDNGYPNVDDHSDEHDDYILKSSDYLVAAQDDAKGLATDVLEYLTDWWKTHINVTDRKLALFLKENGIH